MKLTRIRARNYKCIDDTGWVEIDDLTCLIGKNEAGKTVLMEAIERLNPAHGSPSFTPYDDYPRRRWPEYQDRHETDPDPLITAEFELDDDELERLRERGGRAEDGIVTVTRTYANELRWGIDVDEAGYVDWLRSTHGTPADASADLSEASTLAELRVALEEHAGEEHAGEGPKNDTGDDASGSDDVDAEDVGGADEETDETDGANAADPSPLAAALPDPDTELADVVGEAVLEPSLPAFQYVGEYETLDGTIDVEAFLDRREADDRTASDRVFESLLSVADLDPETLRDDGDWRRTVTELETASSEVTRSVTRYWSQADDLEIDLRGVADGDGRSLEIRVENPHHGVTVEFDRRSIGFRWFFSTFCAVYDRRETDENVVLLLDEPGLHLHPKAKREFLRFLDAEIADGSTLVYSTHSPFMIDVDAAHRTKMVHKDPETGTTVLSDPDEADAYTRYPVRNVFELDVLETLISRSQLLLVEDGTTYEYLYNVSELLEATDAPTLDRGWTVLPIGTLENTHTVRSVFDTTGQEVAVVHDGSEPSGWEPPADVTTVGIGTHAPVSGAATVEDLLSESFYLDVVSRAYASELSAADVPDRLTPAAIDDVDPGAPIVDRLRTYFDRHEIGRGSFDRARPASYLQTHREEFADAVDMDTRKAFGSLNRALNDTLDTVSDEPRGRDRSFLDSLLGR